MKVIVQPRVAHGRQRSCAVRLPRTKATSLLVLVLVPALALVSCLATGDAGVRVGAHAEGDAGPEDPADPDRPEPWSAAAAARRFRHLVAHNIFSRDGGDEEGNDDKTMKRLVVDHGTHPGVAHVRAYCTKSGKLLGFVVGYVEADGETMNGGIMGKRRKNNANVRTIRLKKDEAIVAVKVDTFKKGKAKRVEGVQIDTSIGKTYRLCRQSGGGDGGGGEDRGGGRDGEITSKTLAEQSHHVVGFRGTMSPKSKTIMTLGVNWGERIPTSIGREGEVAVNFVSSWFDMYSCCMQSIQVARVILISLHCHAVLLIICNQLHISLHHSIIILQAGCKNFRGVNGKGRGRGSIRQEDGAVVAHGSTAAVCVLNHGDETGSQKYVIGPDSRVSFDLDVGEGIVKIILCALTNIDTDTDTIKFLGSGAKCIRFKPDILPKGRGVTFDVGKLFYRAGDEIGSVDNVKIQLFKILNRKLSIKALAINVVPADTFRIGVDKSAVLSNFKFWEGAENTTGTRNLRTYDNLRMRGRRQLQSGIDCPYANCGGPLQTTVTDARAGFLNVTYYQFDNEGSDSDQNCHDDGNKGKA